MIWAPVVQSIVGLTSSLVVKILAVLVSTISNSHVFLLKKKLVAFANHIFSAKTLAYILYLMVYQSFNDTWTNDIPWFAQVGSVFFSFFFFLLISNVNLYRFYRFYYPPHNGIVNEITVFRVRVHPRGYFVVLQTEYYCWSGHSVWRAKIWTLSWLKMHIMDKTYK